MLPKGKALDKQDKRDTMVYIVGEKEIQVALSRAGRTEVKRTAICACAVVLATIILVAGTLGAIALWLSFEHRGVQSGHNYVIAGGANHHHGLSAGTRPVGNVDGYHRVTEAFEDVAETATELDEILIDGGDRGSSPTTGGSPPSAYPTKTATAAANPATATTTGRKETLNSAPSAATTAAAEESSFYSLWENPSSSFDDRRIIVDTSVWFGSGSDGLPDDEDSQFSEWSSSVLGVDSYDGIFEPDDGNPFVADEDDEFGEDDSGSGSGDDEMVASGENPYDVVDTQLVKADLDRPQLKTPQDFTMTRYPVEASQYGTLCTFDVCSVGFMTGDRAEVIEASLQLQPQKLTVLKRDGSRMFTLVRDEKQGYRAIILETNGLCLLTRLEDAKNLGTRENSAIPIMEKLRVTLPVELPQQLLAQIGGPIMDSCGNLPVFWAQQVGELGDGVRVVGGASEGGAISSSIVNRIRQQSDGSPPSFDDDSDVTLGGGIHFRCCWCEEYPCPCECGNF